MNSLFNFIVDGGCTCEKKIGPSSKQHLFPHGDRVKILAQGFSDLFFDAAPVSNLFSFFAQPLPVVQMALQTEKNMFESIMRFIADTASDENFGVNFFAAQRETQLFFCSFEEAA